MASPKIKFRCYQCNQLLGVSSAKAGKVVACPKCSTDLIIPDLDDPPAPAGPSATPETTPAFISTMESGLPVELADIRPEDIRVASDDDWNSLPIDIDAPRAARVADSPPFLVPLAPGADGEGEPPIEIASAPTPLSIPLAPVSATPATPVYVPAAPAASGAETVMPPIKVAPASIMPERTMAVRSRDLVLPRSVVATWSLFVLMAQALAFVAGLLAGHYLWRVH